MAGWSDWIFGNLPPQPARPTSQGALLGAGYGYQAMPDMTASITDERDEPFYKDFMKQSRPTMGAIDTYGTSAVGGEQLGPLGAPGFDPMLVAPGTANPAPTETDAYKPSFQPNWRSPYSGQAPYRRFERPLDDPVDQATFGSELMGPNLPRPALTRLPWAPGELGWTPPPSPSGPHNRAGDPNRPGYDNWRLWPQGMTLNSAPWRPRPKIRSFG